MNDFNKLKLSDDWAEGYESPITLKIQEIANKITEEREGRIVAEISEQMGVNVDKHELARALAYDRDQYRKGFEAAWLAREKDVRHWIPATTKPIFTGLYLISIDDLVTVRSFDGSFFRRHDGTVIDVDAWMPLPDPYKDPNEFGGES